MAKIKYDKISKILSIRLHSRKSVDSDMRGNVVIDYDKEGRVVNIDIMKINLDEFGAINRHAKFLHQKERAVA